MKLIIGLGNPGNKYAKTRHNLGFFIADYLKNQLNFSDWREDKKFNAIISEGQIGDRILLAKPQTFMNFSGQAVRALADFYKISPLDIWIIHDDLALPLGSIRISKNSNAGGHNGVESIIKNLGVKEFIRFRIGIHPIGQTFLTGFLKRLTSTKKFVLQKFFKDETIKIDAIKEKIFDAILTAANEGISAAMNKFN